MTTELEVMMVRKEIKAGLEDLAEGLTAIETALLGGIQEVKGDGVRERELWLDTYNAVLSGAQFTAWDKTHGEYELEEDKELLAAMRRAQKIANLTHGLHGPNR